MEQDLNELVEKTQQQSFVMIQFAGKGQAEFTIYRNNVTPAQLLGAASILELQAKNWFIQMENERMQKERDEQLAVPKNEILRP